MASEHSISIEEFARLDMNSPSAKRFEVRRSKDEQRELTKKIIRAARSETQWQGFSKASIALMVIGALWYGSAVANEFNLRRQVAHCLATKDTEGLIAHTDRLEEMTGGLPEQLLSARREEYTTRTVCEVRYNSFYIARCENVPEPLSRSLAFICFLAFLRCWRHKR